MALLKPFPKLENKCNSILFFIKILTNFVMPIISKFLGNENDKNYAGEILEGVAS